MEMSFVRSVSGKLHRSKDRSLATPVANRWSDARDPGGFVELEPEEMKKLMPGLMVLSQEEADALPDPADHPGNQDELPPGELPDQVR